MSKHHKPLPVCLLSSSGRVLQQNTAPPTCQSTKLLRKPTRIHRGAELWLLCSWQNLPFFSPQQNLWKYPALNKQMRSRQRKRKRIRMQRVLKFTWRMLKRGQMEKANPKSNPDMNLYYVSLSHPLHLWGHMLLLQMHSCRMHSPCLCTD